LRKKQTRLAPVSILRSGLRALRAAFPKSATNRVRARVHSLRKNANLDGFCNRARPWSCRKAFKMIWASAPAAFPRSRDDFFRKLFTRAVTVPKGAGLQPLRPGLDSEIRASRAARRLQAPQ
jgi:uncharacterized protein (DUF2267 family)